MSGFFSGASGPEKDNSRKRDQEAGDGAFHRSHDDEVDRLVLDRRFLEELDDLPSTTNIDATNTEQHASASIAIHAAIRNHWRHWSAAANAMDDLVDLCVQHNSAKALRNVRRFRDKCARYMSYYLSWRVNDGCYRNSPASIKCCGGNSHGWDAVSRVFVVESILYDLMGPVRQQRLWDNLKMNSDDVRILMRNGVSILLKNNAPVGRWSARMIMMQLRSTSQRINHIHHLATDVRLRNAISKLTRQCELRAYALVCKSMDYEELQQKSTHEGEGLLSGRFVGKIVCTPQNNCGMSTVSSFGTWTDQFVWSFSRCASKISNVLMWINKLIPEVCVRVKEDNSNALGEEFHERLATFKETAVEKVHMLLGADQLQEQVVNSLYPSIIGVDASVRKIEIIQDPRNNNDVWASAKAIAPTNISKWIDSYVRVMRGDFYLEGPICKEFPDIREFCVLHAFEICTRRDGRNSSGFLSTFFIRTEEIQAHMATFREMEALSVPIVCKIGADYIVSLCGRDVAVVCDDACEALMAWSVCMEKMCAWKVSDLDFSHVYAPIFEEWCRIGEGRFLAT